MRGGYWMDPGNSERQVAASGWAAGLGGADARGLLLADGPVPRGAGAGDAADGVMRWGVVASCVSSGSARSGLVTCIADTDSRAVGNCGAPFSAASSGRSGP